MSEQDARIRQTRALESIARSLEAIAGTLDQQANDDPLSRVERALARAPEVLGFDPTQPGGVPLEEMRP